LQYLVDRGMHWFPRVNFLIGRFPQQRLNRRDEIHYLSSLFRNMSVPVGGAGLEALDDGFDRSGEQDDAIFKGKSRSMFSAHPLMNNVSSSEPERSSRTRFSRHTQSFP
jgi:hypothetical protein